MATVTLDLVDLRMMYRERGDNTAPSLARWKAIYQELKHQEWTYYAWSNRNMLKLRWNYYAAPKYAWSEVGLSFKLPPAPVGCYKMEWRVSVTSANYLVVELGRPLFDCSSFARVAGHTGVQYIETPLWRRVPTWKRIWVWPSDQFRGPVGLPVVSGAECQWTVNHFQVRYTY